MSKIKNSSKWLYLPMEIVERELNGYLLLASEAVKDGWQVVLGTKKEIFSRAEHLPKGVMFLKSIVSSEIDRLRYLKSCGHTLVTQDVEGLIYTCMEEFISVRFTPETVEEPEKILFWGDTQREAFVIAYPHLKDRCFATGSPIADLWQSKELHRFYDSEVEALKDRFGPYILLPSSFGTVNHYMGRDGNMNIMQRDKMVAEDEEKEFYEFWDAYENHVYKIFKQFLAFLPELSRSFPDHKIIIRPHPSESHDTWKKAAEGLENIEVIFEGAISPWLLGADAILHWGCTTGLEGYMMGKPVVAYNPADDAEKEKYDHELPHSISIMAETPKETVEALRKTIDNPDTVLSDYPDIKEGDDLIKTMMSPIDDSLGVTKIMDHLNALEVKEQELENLPKIRTPWKEQIWMVIGCVSQIKGVYAVLPERIRLGVECRAYGRHKTRDIDPDRVERAAQSFGDIRGVDGLKSEALAPNLFHLFKG